MTGSEHVAPGFPFYPVLSRVRYSLARLSEAGFFCAIFSPDARATLGKSSSTTIGADLSPRLCGQRRYARSLWLARAVPGAETVPGFDAVRDASELANVDQAQVRLEETERRLGPYHPSLAAEFVQVAELAMEAGDVSLATSLYDAALHNARVNNGCTVISSCRFCVACWIFIC